MSIVIKDMEMPKTCKECPFSDHEAWCLIPGDWRERYYYPEDERSEHCPLMELSQWIPYSERPPEDGQKCLVTAKALNSFYIDIVSFATDLYSVDKYDFYDKKGKPGWYFFDSDLGYVELPDVIAWQPSPEPYQEVKE